MATKSLEKRLRRYPIFNGPTTKIDIKRANRYYVPARERTINGWFSPAVVIESDVLRRDGEVCPDYRIYQTVLGSGSFSLLPVFAPQVFDILHKILITLGDPLKVTVLDLTAGIGMDSILFTEFANGQRSVHCISVEVDPTTHGVLSANLSAAKLARPTAVIETNAVCGNLLDFVVGLRPHITIVYLDPPWGGNTYWKTGNGRNMLYIKDNSGNKIPIFDVVNTVLKEVSTDRIVLKVPENFDIETFRSRVAAANITVTPVLKGGVSYRRVMIAFYLVVVERSSHAILV